MNGSSINSIHFDESIEQDVAPGIKEERAAALEDFSLAANLTPLRNGEAILGDGPFDVIIQRHGTNIGLIFSTANNRSGDHYTISFSLSPLRRLLKDYAQIVESYYDAIRTGVAAKIEALDMARRGIHNEAAEILIERLDGKIAMDHDTARRLFTIISAMRYDGKGGMR